MAQTSRKRDHIYFSYKEATADTPDTDEMFEGRGTMTFPEPTWMQESDYGKLGSGEHGTKSEIQAIGTPWSYKPQRLSEIAYFLSFFMGKADEIANANSVYQHKLQHLAVSSRTLPTFSFEYGPSGTTKVLSGNVVNEMSIVLAAGGNGVVDCTVSGWGNRHYVTGAALTERVAGSMSTGENSLASEPLVNFKATNFYKADTLETSHGLTSMDFAGEDLGANLVTLTSLINSCTISMNNGMSLEDKLRAGGSGVINDYERGDRRFTVELELRKDDTSGLDTDALVLADTQFALEVLFSGPYISGTAPYALDMLFPVVQAQSGAEDDGSPISRTVPLEIFEDSSNVAAEFYVQNNISTGLNAVKA